MDTVDVPPQAALHPDTKKYLDSMVEMMEKKKIPPLWTVDVPKRRALNKMLIASGRPPMAPCDLVEEVEIPTRGGPRRGKVVRGVPVPAGSAGLPIIVYIHGGGFAIGGIDESEHEIRRYAASVPAVVIAVEYRKTPEHPYPAPDEDCYDTLLWAAEVGRRYGGDPERIVLAGTSCGGCVATATARRSLERGGPGVKLVVAVTPWYDKTLSLPSMRTYASGVHLDWEEIEHYRDMYMPNGAKDADPYNSPALFPAIKGMPPHYILVAECDGVADESYAFAERLKEVGVPSTVVLGKGLIHAFTLLTHLIPVANEYLEDMHAAIRRV